MTRDRIARAAGAALLAAATLAAAAVASCIAFLPGTPCHHDGDCAPGNACDLRHGGYCVAHAPTDGGATDAGANVDGGAADAGANVDAGDLDAGLNVDAGTSDAGPVDAGPPDAGGCTIDPSTCGDGVLETCEACDPGDVDAGGACDDCTANAQFFCALAPSVCVPIGDARIIPAGSPVGAVVSALSAQDLNPVTGKVVIVSVSGGPNAKYTAPGPLNNGGTIIITSDDNTSFLAAGADAFHAKGTTTLVLDGITITGALSGGAVPQALARADGTKAVVDVRRSVFGPSGNTIGLDVKNGATGSFRQSIVDGVGGIGLDLETANQNGVLIVENSVVATNGGGGITVAAGNELDMTFTTVTDNSAGVTCGASTAGSINASLIVANSGTAVSQDCPTQDQTLVDPANPDFVGGPQDTLAHQFRLRSTSVCVDEVTGTDGLPVVDFDNNPRPEPGGDNDDCGAFELQSQ